MRFFACDTRVVENCLVAFLAGDARSILEAREMDFMMIDRVIAGYGEAQSISTMYSSRSMVATCVWDRCKNQKHQCVHVSGWPTSKER